jgi:Matrixin
MVLPGPPPEAPPIPERRSALKAWPVWTGVGVGVVVLLLLARVVVGGGTGGYAFLKTQGGTPVTWNHCHAIRYQVNPKGAPADWQDIVRKAVDEVEKASGFVFADRGTTVKTQLIGTRYQGNEWEPVLIMWSDRYQDGGLGGGVIGLGGPAAIDVNGRLRYVIGQVHLDSTVKDPHDNQMVLEHELGHVLGLGHTGDRSQLMYAGYHGQDGFGSGDLKGLQRLHDVPCD